MKKNNTFIPGGFIIKARCIERSKIANAAPCAREIWNWLLLNANHRDTELKGGISVKRGQLLRRYIEIREGLAWYVGYRKMMYSESQTKASMKYLTSNLMITTTKKRYGVLITILNYDKYQNIKNYEQTNEATNDNSTANPRKKPNMSDKEQGMRKNVKNEKNKNISEFVYPEGWPENLIKKFQEYIQHRKEIGKKITPTAFKKQVKFIETESNSDLTNAIEIIEQTIRNSWTGLFPLNRKNNQQDSNIDAVKEFVNG